MAKCVICNRHPATDNGYCHNCAAKINKERRARQQPKPEKYLTYRGAVVGLFRNGGDKLTGKRLNVNPDRLPAAKTLDLNTYLEGFTRSQVKAFKRAVLTLCEI